jgi:hypothetical protein
MLKTEQRHYEVGEVLRAVCNSTAARPRVELVITLNNLVVSYTIKKMWFNDFEFIKFQQNFDKHQWTHTLGIDKVCIQPIYKTILIAQTYIQLYFIHTCFCREKWYRNWENLLELTLKLIAPKLIVLVILCFQHSLLTRQACVSCNVADGTLAWQQWVQIFNTHKKPLSSSLAAANKQSFFLARMIVSFDCSTMF